MPEGDTVKRTAARLDRALAGEILTRTELRWGDLDGSVLLGRRTQAVVARGKHLLHRIEGGLTVHSHLRMEGSWRIQPTDDTADLTSSGDTIRAVLATRSWTALGIRLGMLDLLATSAEHTVVGHLGPDILGPDWDADRAIANLRASGAATIAEGLLDQRNLAGIGTLYCSEALFLERISPWTPPADLSDEALRALVSRAHRLLHANVAHAVQSTTGERRAGREKYVHARSGRPCLRCGTPIRVAPLGEPPTQRVMFSCPRCQSGLAPGDTGMPQAPLGSGRARRRGPTTPR